MEMTKLEAERYAEDLSPVETRMLLRALIKEMPSQDIARCMKEELEPMKVTEIIIHAQL